MTRRRPKLSSRIARVKSVDFRAIFEDLSGVSLPDRLPTKIACPLPDHDERTPSCMVREDRWWCFGCSRGGDAIDLARYLWDLETVEALERVERELEGSLSEEDELTGLVERARKPDPGPPRDVEWALRVREVEALVSRRLRAYVASPDCLVRALAQDPARYVYDEIDEERVDPPRTERAGRRRLESLRSWALGWVEAVERDVLRRLGRDPLDVATLDGLRYRKRPS